MSKEKLKEYLQSISKERVVELCLQYQFDAKIAEQQLAEKDKEIERLKDFIGCKGCVDVIKKSNEDQTQLAIQELEKMKNWCRGSLNVSLTLYDEIKDYINQQIKELKGE